jgi:DNA-binding transcriptional MerR regulator
MTPRIAKYRIGDLARLSGVSVRMLRHYDQIGLLPAVTAENGYRYYDDAGLERLQEILFYRALDMGLEDIHALLDGNASRLERLQHHQARLREKHFETAAMPATLEQTIAAEKGGPRMTPEELYKPFSPEKQAVYEDWLIDTYGEDMADAIATSKAHLAKAPEGMEERMNALADIEGALVSAFESGATELTEVFDKHRAWVASMWGKPCPPEAYAGLADMYLSHPDFIARYEALAPKFSQWLPAQMKAYAGQIE